MVRLDRIQNVRPDPVRDKAPRGSKSPAWSVISEAGCDRGTAVHQTNRLDRPPAHRWVPGLETIGGSG
jgi:hypothetical protein